MSKYIRRKEQKKVLPRYPSTLKENSKPLLLESDKQMGVNFNPKEFRIPLDEYSTLDVFIYPFMSAAVKYLLNSYSPIFKSAHNLQLDQLSEEMKSSIVNVAAEEEVGEAFGFQIEAEFESVLSKSLEENLPSEASLQNMFNRMNPKMRKLYAERIIINNLNSLNVKETFERTGALPLWLIGSPLNIKFKNGTVFEGFFEHMIPNGYGVLKFKDGTVYKGILKNGKANGFGNLRWNNDSFYEGNFKKNKRHGKGWLIYYDDKGWNEENKKIIKMAHFGEWKLGSKDKLGLTVYGKNNWYDGNWENGLKEGFGIRKYPEGGCYVGYWKNGLHDGQGVMIWANNDVYTGEWKFGKMHGFGTYTWNAFRLTKWLTSPFQNTYVGEWYEGLRHGNGSLYLACGAKLTATWVKGMKHGYGELICTNGKKITSETLFDYDQFTSIRKPLMTPEEKREHLPSEDIIEVILSASVPINAPIYTMDFKPHIYKLFVPDDYAKLYPDDTDFTTWFPTEKVDSIYSLETEWLEKVIVKRGPELNFAYYKYATGGSSEPFEFKPALLRLSLWKMIRDCGLYLTNKTLVDLDEEEGIGCHPFEQVPMFEMVNYLLNISWELYAKTKLFNSRIPGVLASSFDKFIEEVLVPVAHTYIGNVLTLFRYVPLNALLALFNTIKKPATVEKLIKMICPNKDEPFRDILPRSNKFFKKLAKGLSIIHPDGSLEYMPLHDTYFDKVYEKKKTILIEASELSILGLLGIDVLIQVIIEVLPNVVNLERIINRHYKLTFLDFCDILCELIVLYLDKVHGVDKESTTKLSESESVSGKSNISFITNLSERELVIDQVDEMKSSSTFTEKTIDEPLDEIENYEFLKIMEEKKVELEHYYWKNGEDTDNVGHKSVDDDGDEEVVDDEVEEEQEEDESTSSTRNPLTDRESVGPELYESGDDEQLIEDLRLVEVQNDVREMNEEVHSESEFDNKTEDGIKEEHEEEIVEEEDVCLKLFENESFTESLTDVFNHTSKIIKEDKAHHFPVTKESDRINKEYDEKEQDYVFDQDTSDFEGLLEKDNRYRDNPCLAYLEKSKALLLLFNKLVTKSGLIHEKGFGFLKDKLQNEFLRKFLHKKTYLKKKVTSLNNDCLSESDISSDESILSCDSLSVYKNTEDWSMNTDSSNDWCERDSSSSRSNITEKKEFDFDDFDEALSSVSTDSTFTSLTTVNEDEDYDDGKYPLDILATDDEETEMEEGDSSSSITVTLTSSSKETSLGFTSIQVNMGLDEKRKSRGLESKSKPELMIHNKKKDYTYQSKAFRKNMTRALFGKDGGPERYADFLLQRDGAEVLKLLEKGHKRKKAAREIIFKKNDTDDRDTIKARRMTISRMSAAVYKRSKSSIEKSGGLNSEWNSGSKTFYSSVSAIPSSSAKKSSAGSIPWSMSRPSTNVKGKFDPSIDIRMAEEKKPNEYHSFERYIHYFNIENRVPIDYDYFFDLPPIKHPLIQYYHKISDDDEQSEHSEECF